MTSFSNENVQNKAKKVDGYLRVKQLKHSPEPNSFYEPVINGITRKNIFQYRYSMKKSYQLHFSRYLD